MRISALDGFQVHSSAKVELEESEREEAGHSWVKKVFFIYMEIISVGGVDRGEEEGKPPGPMV